jgi:DNA-binding NtrC family response regulator
VGPLFLEAVSDASCVETANTLRWREPSAPSLPLNRFRLAELEVVMRETLPELDELRQIFATMGFVTECPRMTPVLQRAYKAARASDATVLVEGETGTGKQVLARAIHRLDAKRGPFPFVTVHCSTVNEELAESELFGHRKGSFSGATSHRAGLFQAADRGTIFLDDVNDLPLCLQPKLLDVLQRGAIRPVGSDGELQVHARVIAAANQPLEPLVEQRRFRADLFHRLNVIRLTLLPLRERAEDVPILLLEFARRYANLHERVELLEPDLVRYLQTFRFVGNVRELENAVQRMLFLKRDGNSLTCADWLEQNGQKALDSSQEDSLREAANRLWIIMLQEGVPFRTLIKRIEGELVTKALQTGGKTRRDVARLLQTSERTLYHKMQAHREIQREVSMVE